MKRLLKNLAIILISGLVSKPSWASMPKLPVIKNVGIIPVQIEQTSSQSPSYMVASEMISKRFNTAAHKTNKFRFINDDLIRIMWDKPEGRKELTERFELDGYLLLSVVTKEDKVELIARLTDANLSNVFIENETLPMGWIHSSGEKKIFDKVDNLVFRLLNRYPVDLFVTSYHGSFVTLNGGKKQGLAKGDMIQINSYYVKSTHPANGSLLEFNSVKKGVAEIISIKDQSAVGVVKEIIHEGAISVGDGANSPNSLTRSYFNKDVKPDSLHDKGSQKILVEAVTNKPIDVPSKATRKLKPNNRPTPEEKARAEVLSMPSAPSAPSASQEEISQVDPSELPKGSEMIASNSETSAVELYLSKVIDLAYIQTGYRSVKISGAASDSSKFPLWLMNYMGAYGQRRFGPDYVLEVGGALNFGPSSSGGIWGVDGTAKFYYEMTAADMGEMVAKLRFGADGGLYSIGFTDSQFGGYDFMKFGGFAGLSGDYYMPEYGKLEWFGEFALYPIAIGQVGISGTKYALKSTMAYEFRTGGIFSEQKNAFEYGGYISMGSQSSTLANSTKFNADLMSFNALMRYRF